MCVCVCVRVFLTARVCVSTNLSLSPRLCQSVSVAVLRLYPSSVHYVHTAGEEL